MSDYTRYLASKRSVDDRALNQHVLNCLRRELGQDQRFNVFEIGAGLGTMVARLVDWRLLTRADYTLLDVDGQLLSDSCRWLQAWAQAQGFSALLKDSALHIQGGDIDLLVTFLQAELGDYLQTRGRGQADLLIANAFLDLVDVPKTLPGLFLLLKPGGLYWFTINFDGETIFQPELADDERLLRAYHRGMDERLRYGRQAGESKAGRHLFHHLLGAGATVLAAGPSDWVVHASAGGGYPEDEAFFLAQILDTVEEGLRARPEIEGSVLQAWMAERRGQLERRELLYIAHQLDFAGHIA